MKTLVILGMLLAGGAAYADETNCQTYGHDTHCTTTSNNNNTEDFTQMVVRQRERDQTALNQSARGVYNAYASKKTVVNAVLEVNCGKAIKLVRVFADGKLDESDMGSVPVSELDIATIQASLPMLQIIRGCEP